MPYGSSGDVYVLADEYGRVLVQHVEDGDYYQCVAWVDGETRFDFDSASDAELVTQMLNRGFVEGLTIGENLDVTVNIGGLSETYVWDAAKAEFDYEFDSWVNGSRTLTTKWFAKSDGTPELVVVNSADETPVYFVDGAGTQRCLVVEYPGDEGQYFGLDLVSEHPELKSSHSVECYESTAPGEGMATLNIVNFGPDDNIFVITINEDGAYREGSAQVPIVRVPNGIFGREFLSGLNLVVDNYGRIIIMTLDGSSEPKYRWMIENMQSHNVRPYPNDETFDRAVAVFPKVTVSGSVVDNVTGEHQFTLNGITYSWVPSYGKLNPDFEYWNP